MRKGLLTLVEKMILSTFKLGPITARYLKDNQGQVSWVIYPTQRAKDFVLRADTKVHSLIQTKLQQDAYDKNFSNGVSMYRSATTQSLTYNKQQVKEDSDTISVATYLKDHWGNTYIHTLCYHKDTAYLGVRTTFTNETDAVQHLELLSSFCLSGLSPFTDKNPVGQLELVRFRSKWAMEGRIERRPIEDYDLEESWKASGLAVEKFGQLGSMPVRRFFPIVGLTDASQDVTWLVKLAGAASWQLEALRLDDELVLTGGLPDQDYGQWQKTVEPKASFTTPWAYITVGSGRLEAVAHNFAPTTKADKLPVVFNEWATSWGKPSESSVETTVAALKAHDVDYYVIDAGWFADKNGDWQTNHGDWHVYQQAFPNGLKAAVKTIHDAGLKAGLWFEMETVGEAAAQFQNVAHLAKKRDIPITAGTRRFWDMRDPWVQNYLKEKVIATLKDNNFDYLKIDYNDSLGGGVDSPEGLGAGLEDLIDHSLKFIHQIKADCPDLAIENCSSGGHRLTPAFMDITDFSSFSDAHESSCIPLIAANEQNIVPATKNLIWVVLHPEAEPDEFIYRLVSGFLGRICLSGNVTGLTSDQWQTVDAALALYQRCAPLISGGVPLRFGPAVLSYHDPKGWQVAGFSDTADLKTAQQVLLVAHTFDQPGLDRAVLPELGQGWQVQADFGCADLALDLNTNVTLNLNNHSFGAHV
jgi:alpha-galactosidase